MTGIYKITNLINGKCYVGHSREIENRFRAHFQNWYNYHSKEFDHDIRTMGKDVFALEVLEELPNGCEKALLLERELHYIHVLNPEYNVIGKERPQETRKKLSEANKGKKQSQETKAKRKESIRIRHLTIPQTNAGHRKRCATDDGEFESIKACAEFYGVSPRTVSGAIKRNGTVKKHKVWRVV